MNRTTVLVFRGPLVDRDLVVAAVERFAAGDAAETLRRDGVGHEREDEQQEQHAHIAALAGAEGLRAGEPQDDADDDQHQPDRLRLRDRVDAREGVAEARDPHGGEEDLQGAEHDEDQRQDIGDEFPGH